jgi:Tol biopolymer transport system component
MYTWSKGTTALFPGSIAGDAEPQSAAGKIVFTSYRISFSNPEIFIENLDGSNAIRLTNSPGTDHQPSLSPDGHTVVFSSVRQGGVLRIWTMGADGSLPARLTTGSDSTVPESAPRFSPSGDKILFSSPRTNTSQIWTVPVAGGSATQVTHEANGAFLASWGADGNSIFYADGADRTKVHKVVLSSGDVSDYVTGATDVGDQACTADGCLVVVNQSSANADIYAYIGSGDTNPIAILITSATEIQPAILHP